MSMDSNTNSSAMGPMKVAWDGEKADLDGNIRSSSAEMEAEQVEDCTAEPTSSAIPIEMEMPIHSEPTFICNFSIKHWRSILYRVKMKQGADGNWSIPTSSEVLNIVQKVPFLMSACKEQCETLSDTSKGENDKFFSKVVIQTYLSETCNAVEKVYTQLLLLSNLSQSEEGASYDSRKRSADGHSKTSIPTHELENWKRHQKAVPIIQPGETIAELKEESQLLKTLGDKQVGCFGSLTNIKKKFLQKFNDSLQDAFGQANLFGKTIPKNYKESLNDLQKKLLGQTSGADDSTTTFHLPGPLADEVRCVQPFLLTCLQSLGAIVENSTTKNATIEKHEGDSKNKKAKVSTPPRIVKVNRTLANTNFRHARIADNAIAADGNFIFPHYDDSVEVTSEIKPGERVSENQKRSGKGPKSLHAEGSNQKLSHLAKHVHVGFNFLGVGTDTVATGVYMTVTHVQITQLKLENMGKRDAKLVLYQTPLMPLLSAENFAKYVKAGSGKFMGEWSEIKEELYETGETAQAVEDNSWVSSVPSGLVALFNLMTTSRKDLFGPSGFKSNDLGEYLGAGSFASVYRSNMDENLVVKLSRYGAYERLRNEFNILNALSTTVDGIVRIAEGKVEISVSIGGASFSLPALILTPRGIPVVSYLLSLDKDKRKAALRCMGSRLLSAVDALHSKDFFHNDVSVHNILVETTEAESTVSPPQPGSKVFLTDFGHASKGDLQLTGFVGTARYTHRQVFRKYPSETWHPTAQNDKSALAFSLATVSNNGRCPWMSFQPKSLNTTESMKELNDWANGRSQKAWDQLKGAEFGEQWEGFCFDDS